MKVIDQNSIFFSEIIISLGKVPIMEHCMLNYYKSSSVNARHLSKEK